MVWTDSIWYASWAIHQQYAKLQDLFPTTGILSKYDKGSDEDQQMLTWKSILKQSESDSQTDKKYLENQLAYVLRAKYQGKGIKLI